MMILPGTLRWRVNISSGVIDLALAETREKYYSAVLRYYLSSDILVTHIDSASSGRLLLGETMVNYP